MPRRVAAPSIERMRPSLVLALLLVSCAIACNSGPTPTPSAAVSERAATQSAAAASARPSPTNEGRIVTFYDPSDVRIDPVNGVTTVCDFTLVGTIFDFRSAVDYRVEPLGPGRQGYSGQGHGDDNGMWRSQVISLTDGDYRLTVVGALTHPDQTYAIRVACPGGRTPTPSPVPTIKALADAGNATLLDLVPQGRIFGKIAWVTKVAVAASGTQGLARSSVLELWAVPLDRATPRLAVRYRSAHFTGSVDANMSRRQFSPDGRRIVLSVATGADAEGHGLAVIDLEAGRVVMLFGGASEQEIDPAWSPDGANIAFIRPAASELSSEIWIVAPDGSGARRLRARAGRQITSLAGPPTR